MPRALFRPLKLRGVELANRIVVAPMGQYSAEDGSATDWHLMHLGQFAVAGAGLLIAEATAVSPAARITHGCLGLYSNANEATLKRIVDFCREHSKIKLGLQLSHSGRKGSSQFPWITRSAPLGPDEGAWETLGCSGIPRAEGWPTPKAATAADIETVIADHVAAVRRADRIGIDLLEINAAHGYLFHEFLSPITNRRDDRYGGDVDGRLRFLLEAFEAMRAVWPEAKALGVRLSAEDYVEGGWSLEETVELCHRLKTLGCDFATISSGGLVLEQNVPIGEGHQVPLAATVKRETGLVTMAVGMIQRPAHAEAILEAGEADLIALARAMLHDPHWPWHAAAALDAEVDFPVQYIRGYKSRWHRGLRGGG